MKIERIPSYNIQIWVGLREQYTEKVHSLESVRTICDTWVNHIGDCVTITPTEFRYVDGSEPGVIVGYINYPRFPRSEYEINSRSIRLAEKLMIGLNQNRVTITTPIESIMLTNPEETI